MALPNCDAFHQSQMLIRICSAIRARPSIMTLIIVTMAMGAPAAISAGTMSRTRSLGSVRSGDASPRGMRKRKRGRILRPPQAPGTVRGTRCSNGISKGLGHL